MQPNETARKIASTVLQGLAGVKNTELAALLDKSEATISRTLAGSACLSLDEWAQVLACAGLTVVTAGDNTQLATIPRPELEALRVFARKGLAET